MKKIIKNLSCLSLALVVLTSNIQYVYGYTTSELQIIKTSNKATVLYTLKNKDLELYVSKSDAEKTSSSTLTYTGSDGYKVAGTREGRRAGITQSIDDYTPYKQPSQNNATKALSSLSDDEILAENKISSNDANKTSYLDAYKVGYLDAYSTAEYQLSGYDFGEYRAKGDIAKYYDTDEKPPVSVAYANVSKNMFMSTGISASDKYAKTFEAAFKVGYENAYSGEQANTKVAYDIGSQAGAEAAERIKNGLGTNEKFEDKMTAYLSSNDYSAERSKRLNDFASYSNLTDLEAEYDKGFSDAISGVSAVDTTTDLLTAGNSTGKINGTMIGEAFAKNDYAKNINLDANRAYNDYINSTDLTVKFKLNLMPGEYVIGFQEGFEEGFKLGYTGVYVTSKEETVTASQFAQLPSEGDVVADHTIVADSKNLDVTMTLDFGFGNFFDESFVSVFDTGRSYIHNKSKYTAYSNIYEVDVYSNIGGAKQNYINLKKPMTISFTHDLGENVGVYKLVGNQLRYIHTQVDKDLTEASGKVNVYATIPSGKYYGGTYVLLADEQVLKVKDIQNNWNFTSLDTYNRRGWLPVKNSLATPEANITRAQLAHLLERNLNKDNQVVSAPVKYNDQSKFYGYDNAINFCVSRGYMKVDSKNNFKPTDYVSYAELETILSKALGYKVSFSTYDTKMKNELFHKSNYGASPKKYITKSETIFTLLSIFQ